MKIYTSYFAKINKLPKDAMYVSIALYPPNWYKGYTCKLLAPTNKILGEWKQTKDELEYRKNYFADILNKIDAQKLVNLFSSKCKGRDIILLCYESPEKFCHRHLVAEWLQDNGFPCNELIV